MLERMDEKHYRQVRKNFRDELDSAKGDLEQSRLHIQETVDQKRWIDWVEKFHEMYEDVDHLAPEDRKEYLQGVVDRLTVNLNPETNKNLIDFKFKYPIVGDKLEYVDESQRSKGYEIIEGKMTQILRGLSYQSMILKKETEMNGLGGDEHICWNKVRHSGGNLGI